MDKIVFGGLLLVLVIASASAGFIIYNSLNGNTSEVNNALIGDFNKTTTNDNKTYFNDISNVEFIPLSGGYSQSAPVPGPSPGPGPVPDPMDRIISLFDAYVKSTFIKSGIPGSAIIVVRNDKIIYMNCLGVKDLNTQASVDPDTLFGIGSTTKQFSATNIAQLVDDGLMTWDDPITKYYSLDEFQLYEPYVTNSITLRDCLLHRSGLPFYGGDCNIQIFNYSYSFGLHQLRYLENTTPFRSNWQYNNVLYALPAFYASRANNTGWNELMKDLLEPLGMNTATLTFNDFMNSPDHATPYRTINGTLEEFHLAGLDGMGPSGSLACSINHMVNWLKFQIEDTGMYNGQQIVSKVNLDETRRGQIDVPGSVEKYGFGWMVGKDIIWHAGDTLSSGSYLQVIPSLNMGIAILSTGGQYGYAFNMASSAKFNLLLNGLENIDLWPFYKQYTEDTMKPVLDPPSPPIIAPLPLGAYIGVYNSSFYRDLNITTKNDTLVCFYGNNSQPFDLKHWNGNVFEEPTNNYAFNFTQISNGTAEKLTVTFIDPPTPAVFNHTNIT